jgi:peptidyl-prolyl cis-trans isomerase-like 1
MIQYFSMLKIVIPVIAIFLIALIGFVMFIQPKSQGPAKIITIHPTITSKPTPTTIATISATLTTLTPSTSSQPTIKVMTPTPTPTMGIIQNATQAVIHTVKGDITIQLYPQDAPKTVANFATLAKRKYYNNLTFHRVEAGFVIQGGDPNGDGTGGVSIYGKSFEDELNPNTPSYKAGYLEGVVAMANSGPNTNGSQFFIMLADNSQLPHAYTIFGKVTVGMDVVKKIQIGDKMTTIDIP